MKNTIKSVLDKNNIAATPETLEEIEFLFLEYTNFLNENYRKFGNDWIRASDDKIIYNIREVLEDYERKTI